MIHAAPLHYAHRACATLVSLALFTTSVQAQESTYPQTQSALPTGETTATSAQSQAPPANHPGAAQRSNATAAGVAAAQAVPTPAPLPSARAEEATGEAGEKPLGKLDGELRSYVMSTVNGGDARDWTQWALGGHLGYRSPALHGLSVGTRFYVARGIAGNSDRLDDATGLASRYEAGLFDFTDLNNKEVVILGEAYLAFDYDGHHLWAGRHRLKTPMLNPQDGRMIPTLFQGAWYQNTSLAGLTFDLGFISHAYARSGPRWTRIEDTLGIYPQGRTVAGSPASYYRELESAGIFAAGISYTAPLFSVNAWDYAFENLFNTVYADAFLTPSTPQLSFRFGAQYVGGQRLGDGGSDDAALRYFDRKTYHVLGAKAEVKTPSELAISANYNRVTAHGPFLFPRELGVEPLFVFLKRERTEGSGDAHAFSVQVDKAWALSGPFKRLTTALAYGHYYRTDPREAELNKYGFPSLYQLNWDTFVHFGGALQGLVGELLLVYKGPLADTYANDRFVVNKVHMFHADLIANYSF